MSEKPTQPPTDECPFHDLGLPLSLPPEVQCTCPPDGYDGMVCPVCQCAIEDGNTADCTDCGVVACEDCIQPWDDVIGDLCTTCRRSYA